MTNSEQRKHNRLSKNYFIQLKEFKFPMNIDSYVDANVSDISAGGICVENPQLFKQDDHLQIKMHVPRLNKFMPGFFKFFENDAEQYIHAIVTVAWVEGGHMGLRFLDMDQDVVTGIQGLLDDAVRRAEKKADLKEANQEAQEA